MHAQVLSEALLATAIVDLVNAQRESKACHVFLDPGSQAHFITDSVATFLKLARRVVDTSVSCLDDARTEVKHSVAPSELAER